MAAGEGDRELQRMRSRGGGAKGPLAFPVRIHWASTRHALTPSPREAPLEEHAGYVHCRSPRKLLAVASCAEAVGNLAPGCAPVSIDSACRSAESCGIRCEGFCVAGSTS
jgi:hypothetical protein